MERGQGEGEGEGEGVGAPKENSSGRLSGSKVQGPGEAFDTASVASKTRSREASCRSSNWV